MVSIKGEIGPLKCLLIILMASLTLAGCGESLTDDEYLGRAKEYHDKGQLDASIVELKNALGVNPDNIDARWLLGDIYLETGQGAAAEKELRRLRELGMEPESLAMPSIEAMLLQGKLHEAIDFEVDYPTLDTESKARIWALRGHAYRGLDKQEEAVKSYEQARNINPDEAEAYAGLALVAINDRELETARQLLNKALELDPSFVSAWSLSGDLARHKGDVDKAEADYDMALAQPGWNLDVRLKRALVRIQRGKYDLAKEDIRFIRSKLQRSPAADYADGLILLEQGNYPEAQNAFENALSNNRKYYPAVFFLGVTHTLQGNNEQARAQLTQYTQKYPNDARAQQLLSVIYLRDNNYAEARQRLVPILQQHPDDLLTLKLMANIAMKLGNTTEAIDYMRKVADQEPDVAESHLRLGLGLLVGGEGESGVLELNKALELETEYKLVEFVLVLNYIREGKLDEAFSAAREFTIKYPDSPMAWNLLGLVQIKQKQTDAARLSFEKVLEVHPGEPGAANNLAILALQRGEVDEAIRLYETVLEHRPGDIDTVVKLAKLLTRQGHTPQLQNLLEETVKAFPNELEPVVLLADIYQKKGESSKALGLLREVQDQFAEYPVYLATLGHFQLENGDTVNATNSLERLVKMTPRSALSHQKLAEAYYLAGNMTKLEPVLERALALDPDHLPSGIMRVKMLIQQGQFDAAASHLKELHTAYPEYPELFVLEARLALAQDRPEDGVKAYQEAMKRVPDRDLVGQLALAHLRAGQQEAGIQTMKDWLTKHPDDFVVQYNLANLYLAVNRNEEARQAFTKVIERRPDHILALTNLALLTQATDPDKAMLYAELALKLAPDASLVQDAKAQLLLQQGKTKEALRMLDNAIVVDPNNLTIRYHHALALSRQGEKVRAIRELQDILKEDRRFRQDEEAQDLLRILTDVQD